MKIALLGDIGLLEEYSLAHNKMLPSKLKRIADYLSTFDLVVGNLESPLSIKKKTWGAKSSYVCTDIENIKVLKLLHINALTLANNHIYDFGKEGLETTKKLLKEVGIEWFGVDGKDYKVERDGNKLAFNGFCCYSTNPLRLSKKRGQNGINTFNIPDVKDILVENARKGWLNILAIHSGIEHVNMPGIDQIKVSRLFGDTADYIWHGHHPHVVQGIEQYKNSLIAHSLGNFCFAGNRTDKNRPVVELSENNRIGMILEIEIENNKLKSFTPTLIHIGEDGSIELMTDSTSVERYSEMLKDALPNQEEYKRKRKLQRSEYLEGRKNMRNLSWYLKRLRYRYIKLMLTNRRNHKKYLACVHNHLKD